MILPSKVLWCAVKLMELALPSFPDLALRNVVDPQAHGHPSYLPEQPEHKAVMMPLLRCGVLARRTPLPSYTWAASVPTCNCSITQGSLSFVVQFHASPGSRSSCARAKHHCAVFGIDEDLGIARAIRDLTAVEVSKYRLSGHNVLPVHLAHQR